MKTFLTLLLLLPIMVYVGTPVIVNGYSNYNGYNTSEGCYGLGCLPTATLLEVLKQPSYYSPEYTQNERLINAIEESNEINKEQLKLEAEDSDQ